MPALATLQCVGSADFVERLRRAGLARPAGDEELPKGTVIVEFDEQPGYSPVDKVRALSTAGCTVVVACLESSLPDAVEAVRAGARWILLKPISRGSLRQLPGIQLCRDAESSTSLAVWRERFAPEIIGESAALREALAIAARAGDCECPVLITGTAREGRFMVADGGTLLLDEIGEMDLGIQSKLLRVLQDYQVTRVGESRSQRVDVRILAATNRDLESMVESGAFREDLYYRLNVLQIEVPPLRHRREDIPLLVERFVTGISTQRKLAAPRLSAEAHAALMAHDWPGNIRQLHNVIERLVILRSGDTIEAGDLPIRQTRSTGMPDTVGSSELGLRLPPGGIDLRDALQRLEDSLIHQALVHTGGNRNQAARILGLNRTTLVEKLRKRPSAVAVA